MVTAEDQRLLSELNVALKVFRSLADENGYVEGAPLETVYAAWPEPKLALSRVRLLITELGHLGWREHAWLGPRNTLGSKVIMGSSRIENLFPLPAKLAEKELDRAVADWFADRFDKGIMLGKWTITLLQKGDAATVNLISYSAGTPRGKKMRWYFDVEGRKKLPDWVQEMLEPRLKHRISAHTLYELWQNGRAKHEGEK